jgi:excisionase family DNA binding protein
MADNAPLTTSEAARMIGVSAQTIRVYVDSGKLAAQRTQGGYRLIARADAQRLRQERQHDRRKGE